MTLTGKGDIFRLRIKHYPEFPLWHADHVFGSRQDDCANAVKCAFWNRPRHAEFLDELLRFKDVENKLEASIFVCLSSVKMTRMLRAMIIISIEISEQMHWLSACAYELAKYNWSNRSVSRQFDILERGLSHMLEEPSLFTDEDFMMNIFKGASHVIPEFND